MKRSTPELPRLLDARADCVIRLRRPSKALEVWPCGRSRPSNSRRAGANRYWFGFNDAENVWQPLGPDSSGACHWFCAALQLVNRQGSIGETDFMRFSGGVQRVADALDEPAPALPPRRPCATPPSSTASAPMSTCRSASTSSPAKASSKAARSTPRPRARPAPGPTAPTTWSMAGTACFWWPTSSPVASRPKPQGPGDARADAGDRRAE